MLAFMRDSGIETDAVRVIPGASPGLYLITVEDGERSFSYWRDTSAARQLADDRAHLATALAHADIIHFSGITLGILPAAAGHDLLAAVSAARKRGAVVAFDSNFRPRLWRHRGDVRAMLMAAAATASIVLPGLDDEQAVFGPCSAGEVAQRYRQAGADIVAVKDGARGCDVSWSGGHVHVPAATPKTVVDTSAAGDSFAAGFLCRLSMGGNPVAAAQCGAAVAAEVVAGHGALVALPSRIAACR